MATKYNPEKKREYYLLHKAKILEDRKKAYQTNPDKFKEASKAYIKANPEKHNAHNKRWRLDNLEKVKIAWRKYAPSYRRNKYKNDPQYRLSQNIRTRIRNAITNKGNKSASTQKLLGATFDVVRKHIELQFKEGMTWENYRFDTWHIDHIIPCNSFDLTDPEQQRKCFHYTNLQPLWAVDNLKKGSNENFTTGDITNL